MTGQKKAITALAVAQLAVAAIIVLTPQVIFPVCEELMRCHYSYMAEIGTAAVVVAASVAAMLSRGLEAPRVLSMVTAVCGAFVALYPSSLIGVCGSTRMACHYGLLPVWNIMGGILILLSVAMFFAAREERV